MSGLIKRVPRRVMIAIHDLVATAVAILASFYIRFEEAGLSERRHALIYLLPAILLYAAFVYCAVFSPRAEGTSRPAGATPSI